MKLFNTRTDAKGQALAIMVLAMTTLLAAVAVTVDGGNAFQQQRTVQNGSDAASLAGAVKLGNYAACSVWSCAPPTDSDVRGAVDTGAAANGIDVQNAYYTDICGTPLRPDGTAAKTGNNVNLAQAAEVGGGVIPPDAGGTANCATGDAGPTRGVLVFGHRSAPTFIAGIIGINTWEIVTQATAVSMYGACASSQGCALLPIAFPVNVTTCDAQGNAVDAGVGPWLLDVVYKIPLCKNNPGNVGWIDWSPKAGGKQEVADAIAQPKNSPISFASWQYVVEPGNPQSSQILQALRALEGEPVRTVQFDHTCGADPDSSYPIIYDAAQWYGCPSQAELDGGSGSNMWYRLHHMIGFVMCTPDTNVMPECDMPGDAYGGLHDAYMSSGQGDIECETAGNGARSCIVGKFVELPYNGFGGGDDSPVQLIR
jgi:Putative Flp pilus-assembly TadE/G-like